MINCGMDATITMIPVPILITTLSWLVTSLRHIYRHIEMYTDMMAGQWYAKACGLESIVPEEYAFASLRVVFDYNVKKYKGGELGAVNGMRPDGRPGTSLTLLIFNINSMLLMMNRKIQHQILNL
jgi:hypothetical protein